MKTKDITLKTVCFVIIIMALFATTVANAANHQEAPFLVLDPPPTPPIYVGEGDKVIVSMFLPHTQKGNSNVSCPETQNDFAVNIINIEKPDDPIFTEIVSLPSGGPGIVREFNIGTNFTGSISLVIELLDSRSDNGSRGAEKCPKQRLIGSLQVMNENGCSLFARYELADVMVVSYHTSGSGQSN